MARSEDIAAARKLLVECLAPKTTEDRIVLFDHEHLAAASLLFYKMPPDFDEACLHWAIDRSDLIRAIRRHDLENKPKRERKFVPDADTVEEESANKIKFETVTIYSAPVSTGEMLEELITVLRRFIFVQPAEYLNIALWIMFTWIVELYDVVPYIAFTSVDPNCGKTTIIDLLSVLTLRGYVLNGPTIATVFRLMDSEHPCLFLDEYEFLSGRGELAEAIRGIINAGTRRRTAKIPRCKEKKGDVGSYDVLLYDTFGPKGFGLIGDMVESLDTRSIHFVVERHTNEDEPIEDLTEAVIQQIIASGVTSKLARWATDIKEELRFLPIEMPPDFSARNKDKWRPLFQIATLADESGDILEQAIAGARELLKRSSDPTRTYRGRLLNDIRELFVEKQIDRFATQANDYNIINLCDSLLALPDSPWTSYGKGHKPITSTEIAYLLKKYGITPGQIRVGELRPNGYQLEWFRDAFRRYLAPLPEGKYLPKDEETTTAPPHLTIPPPKLATSDTYRPVWNRAEQERIVRYKDADCEFCDGTRPALGTHLGSAWCANRKGQRGHDYRNGYLPYPDNSLASISAGGPKAHCNCKQCLGGWLDAASKRVGMQDQPEIFDPGEPPEMPPISEENQY